MKESQATHGRMLMGTLFRGGTVILPTLAGFGRSITDVLVEGGLIAAIEHGLGNDGHEVVNLEGLVLAPGLIDIHTHGGAGADTMDAKVDGLRKMASFYASHGVTSFCATTMTMEAKRIIAAVHAVREFMSSWKPKDGAQPLGVHLEGPYINAKMKGAQPEEYIRTGVELDCRLLFGEDKVVRMITLAPEIEANRPVIEEAVRRGIIVVAGHCEASYEEMVEAQKMGVNQSTHTWNQMKLPHHRHPETVGAALQLPGFYAQLIVDGVHIHPAMVDLSIRARGTDGILLITDSICGAGMPDGEYELGGHPIAVKDGEVRLPDGTLAGSALTMDRAVWLAYEFTGLPLEVCVQMASWNQVKALGLSDRGAIAPGMRADLVVLNPEGRVEQTVIAGGTVYKREAA